MSTRREAPTRTTGRATRQPPGGWLARLGTAHAQALFDSLGRLWRQPLGSALSALVLGLTLALPAALNSLLDNLEAAGAGWQQQLQITVLLVDAASDDDAERLARDLAQRAGVAAAEARSRAEALAEFEQHSGLGEAVALLPENPLPAMVLVTPVAGAGEAAIAQLRGALQSLPEADEVLLDRGWLQRLYALLAVLERVVLIFAIALGAAVLVIVGNTIRLDVAARREEIEVMKLIGAPDAFIRRPFLYTGFWYGLIGALLALLMVGIALAALAPPVERLSALYGSEFRLQGPSAQSMGLVLLAGCALGWLGAWLAVLRQLRAIEPA